MKPDILFDNYVEGSNKTSYLFGNYAEGSNETRCL